MATLEYSAVLGVLSASFACLLGLFICLFVSFCSVVCLFVFSLDCACVRVCPSGHTAPCGCAGTPTAEFLCLNCDTFSVLTDRASLDHTGEYPE